MSRRSGLGALAAGAVLVAGAALVAACAPATAPAAQVLHGPSAASPDFTGLAFPDAANGWLLGEPAAAAVGAAAAAVGIWHTATAGATWQEQWHGAGSGLSVTAPDADHAWVLITCPAGRSHQPSCGRKLLATSDGGRRWRMVAVMAHNVNQVQFVTDSLGIATADNCLNDPDATRCPGKILVSHDGGATWATVLTQASPAFATASPAGQLWAAQIHPGLGLKGGSQGPDVTFLTSVNGGRSWQRLGQLAGVGPLTTRTQVTLAATSEGLAWAAVFDMNSCAMHGCGVANLFQSVDGGTTWTQDSLVNALQSGGCGSDTMILSVAPDRSAWAAAGRNGGACSPPFGLMFRYSGAGWQQLQPWQLTGIGALAAVSHDVAYALSDQGVLARTGDGGQQWTQLLPAAAPTGQLAAVSATTALGAQDAVDAGAVLRSGNGGRSWDVIAQLPGVITQLDFPSADDGVAVTYQGGRAPAWQLWRSRDLGAAWYLAGRLPAGNGNDGIFGPWMSTGGHGLLLTVTGNIPWERDSGGSGPTRIWTTSDWGATWTEGGLLPLGGDTLQGPADFAYAPGSAGGLASGLADGQAGWTGWLAAATASFQPEIVATRGRALVPLPVPSGLLQLTSPGAGFAWRFEGTGPTGTSELGTLYRTADGGRTWQRARFRLDLPAGSQGAIQLAFSDARHGWLIAGGATWRTADGGRTWTRS
jgi:photosystem II stability/assembly factor-like uncharacterized protein